MNNYLVENIIFKRTQIIATAYIKQARIVGPQNKRARIVKKVNIWFLYNYIIGLISRIKISALEMAYT